jgi:hypothetical protein
VQLDIDDDDMYTTSYSGSLVDTQLAACMRAAVDAALAELPVPRDVVWPSQKIGDVGLYP